MHIKKYPRPPLWFIAYTNDIYSYGKIESDNCMETGLENIEYFEIEAEYMARCEELGIDLTLDTEFEIF